MLRGLEQKLTRRPVLMKSMTMSTLAAREEETGTVMGMARRRVWVRVEQELEQEQQWGATTASSTCRCCDAMAQPRACSELWMRIAHAWRFALWPRCRSK